MNVDAFNADRSYLFSVIDRYIISSKEAAYRKNEINQAFAEMEKTNCIDARYCQHAHEIKSIPFLSQFGKLTIANDSAHRPGCDFELDASEHYYVECVCASAGDKKNGLDRFCVHDKIINCNAKKAIINSRFTSALQEKVIFYYRHTVETNVSISANRPYIIFLSTGGLVYEYFAEKYGFALTDILLGRGNPQITFNAAKNEVIEQGYSHNSVLQKWNGKKINCNLFCDPSFVCVSAILFCNADLLKPYSAANTWLFINPYAKIPIVKRDFHGLIYWSGKPGEMYCARKNGYKAVFDK